jgi:Flp pilus assembly protein TadG
MFRRVFSTVRALRRDRRAATAMEFALVAPVLISAMMGMLEYGFVFYGYNTMQQASHRVARQIAVNTVSLDTAQSSVAAMMPRWISGATVTAWRTNTADPSRSSIAIRVTVPAGNTTPIHLYTRAFPFNMTTTIVVTQELPFEN